MSYIIISQTCGDCGGKMAFLITEDKPTQYEIDRLEDELGGMWCINSRVKEIKEDEINIIDDE